MSIAIKPHLRIVAFLYTWLDSIYQSAENVSRSFLFLINLVLDEHDTRMTRGEIVFEQFCTIHAIAFERVDEGHQPTPDYIIALGDGHAVAEVKQIDKDENFTAISGSRTIGDHVRAKINEARNQVRVSANGGKPTILLIYNNLDPLQLFGTEQHDFVAAMYGEPTHRISVKTGQISDFFEGLNRSFRPGKNDSFSAVGLLKCTVEGPVVHLYENMHAKVPLEYSRLPEGITYTRFEVQAHDGA